MNRNWRRTLANKRGQGGKKNMGSQLKRGECVISNRQLDKLFNEIHDIRDLTIIKVLYFGAMRVSEVSKFRIEHINFDEQVITIYESKKGKTRTITPPPELFSAIKLYIQKRTSGYVFPSVKGEALTTRTIQYIVSKWGERLQIKTDHPTLKHLNAHSFRHLRARHLKDEGKPMEYIQKYLGHSSYSTTADTYGTLSISDMKKIARE